MNTEYINLSNNTSEVKDEFGNIEKRDNKVNDKILIFENKIKKVKEEKEKIQSELKDTKREIEIANKLLEHRNILILIALLGGFALGGAFTGGVALSSSLNAIISGVILGSAITSIVYTRYVHILNDAKKRAELLETKLEEANKLEEKYENELENAKELLNTDDLKVTLEPISLKEKNEIELPKIEKEIEENTEKKLEEKQKKLVLKK